jgi:DNA-directed RNA polymerase I subunit RPA49
VCGQCSYLCPSELILYDIASFPHIIPPKNTAFNISVREEEEGKEFVNCSSTIAGETDTIEFSGSANDGSDGAGSRCGSLLSPRVSVIYSTFPEYRYFLAVHRPGTSKLILHPTPVYLISRQIKALKNFKSTKPDNLEYSQARSTLGKVFGTKKAKTAIHAQERNKIDVGAMEDVAGVLQDRIDEATENLPSQGAPRFFFSCEKCLAQVEGPSEKMEDSANAARLIPVYNIDAERPEDIYPLHNIVPEPEWATLDSLYSKLKKAADDRSRTRLLPNARSDWLQHHLMLAYSSPKPKSKIVYVPSQYRIHVYPAHKSIID